jgi:hypothetical protein
MSEKQQLTKYITLEEGEDTLERPPHHSGCAFDKHKKVRVGGESLREGGM